MCGASTEAVAVAGSGMNAVPVYLGNVVDGVSGAVKLTAGGWGPLRGVRWYHWVSRSVAARTRRNSRIAARARSASTAICSTCSGVGSASPADSVTARLTFQYALSASTHALLAFVTEVQAAVTSDGKLVSSISPRSRATSSRTQARTLVRYSTVCDLLPWTKTLAARPCVTVASPSQSVGIENSSARPVLGFMFCWVPSAEASLRVVDSPVFPPLPVGAGETVPTAGTDVPTVAPSVVPCAPVSVTDRSELTVCRSGLSIVASAATLSRTASLSRGRENSR